MGSPTKTQQWLQTKPFPMTLQGRALPEGLCLSVQEEDEGHYLTGSPRLFVRPVLVVADIPPLDLQGVGGGAAAAEGARHLHILTRLRRHVVGGLGEESGCRQSRAVGACGDTALSQPRTMPPDTQSHQQCLDPSLVKQTQPLQQRRPIPAIPNFSFPTPSRAAWPHPGTLQGGVGGKGGSRSLWPPAPTASLRPLLQNECGTCHTSEVKETNGA